MAAANAPYTIKVVDANGSPVKGAFVTVTAAAAALPEMSFETGPEGTASLRLPDGEVRLLAHHKGRAGQFAAQLGLGSGEQELTVRLDRGTEGATYSVQRNTKT
ncbi:MULTISPECIES: hypothetical protein [Aurantimonas]|uniref:hypothetical protein n=1 Tax=Aurantimonas TaxID=182269 RepID=UPI003511B5D1